MKKYNRLIAVIVAVYIIISFLALYFIKNQSVNNSKEYMVEINRIYQRLAEKKEFVKLDLEDYNLVFNVSFLYKTEEENKERLREFYTKKSSYGMEILPLYMNDELLGYLRFDFITNNSNLKTIILVEGFIALITIVATIILLYVKSFIIKPFNELSEIPYELSKGHLRGEIKESKGRYFGNFLWGISLLRDNLNYHKIKEMKLEKDKKLLLLTISHDIKTPLNTIKLYAKALKDGIYDSEEKKISAAKAIEEKTIEIDNFVKEIIKTSSEDIIDIEVKEGEFYLKELVDKIDKTYKEKCALIMTEFQIEEYDNRLLKGDIDRSIEVIENIIENAFKYGDGKSINISFYEEEYCQLIRIFNTGKSVNKNEFNHFFDSFFRGSNIEGKEGNGLGLYICKRIMEKMDGEIFAQCEEWGMSFILVFK